MKCPKCKGKIKITHSYSAGDSAKSMGGKCKDCGYKVTIIAIIAEENPKHGKGAYAYKKKLEKSCKLKDSEVNFTKPDS